MADLRDLGSKCTCPSRKFPCKHVLGLLWLNAEAIVPFAPDRHAGLGQATGSGDRAQAAAQPKTVSPDAPAACAKDLRAVAQLAEPEAARGSEG